MSRQITFPRASDSNTVSQLKIAPGPKGYPVAGNLPARHKAPVRFFIDSWLEFGDIVRFKFGSRVAHLVSHPNYVKHVLRENSRNYGKQVLGYKKLGALIGQGLLTSDGDFWLRQRRIAQPAFHRQRIASLAETMTASCEEMLERWDAFVGRGEVVDIAAEMKRTTLHVLVQTLLTSDVTGHTEEIGEAFTVALEYITSSFTSVFNLSEILPTARRRRFRRAVQTLDRIVMDIIERRRQSDNRPDDLLTLLMDARDEQTGEGMLDRQLRDEVMTMFLAGHETTAYALAWTWYLLSMNPEARRKLVAEIDDVLGQRRPTLADVPQLKYTRMVFMEAMRLYPPPWVLPRSATADDEIGGYHIPADSVVYICPYITHRHPAVWENPEGFDPEHFAPDKPKSATHDAYLPFGAGPHLCIGNDFAMLEAQLIIARVTQKYLLNLAPGRIVEPEPLTALRPRYGMMMTVHHR